VKAPTKAELVDREVFGGVDRITPTALVCTVWFLDIHSEILAEKISDDSFASAKSTNRGLVLSR
jgi:hypothetical protein